MFLESQVEDSGQALGVSKFHSMGDGCPRKIVRYPDAILGAMDDGYPKLILGLVSIRLSKLRSLIGCLACLAQSFMFVEFDTLPKAGIRSSNDKAGLGLSS